MTNFELIKKTTTTISITKPTSCLFLREVPWSGDEDRIKYKPQLYIREIKVCRARRKQSVLDREREREQKLGNHLKKKQNSSTGSDAFSYCAYYMLFQKKKKKVPKDCSLCILIMKILIPRKATFRK